MKKNNYKFEKIRLFDSSNHRHIMTKWYMYVKKSDVLDN